LNSTVYSRSIVLKFSLIKSTVAKASNFLISVTFNSVWLMDNFPAKPVLSVLSKSENKLRSLLLPATSKPIKVLSLGWYLPFIPPTCILEGAVS